MAIATIEKQGDTLKVRPEGRLDTIRTPLLDAEWQPHLEGIQKIEMDFTDVEYISSSCLRLLLWLEQQLEERGGGMQVVHASQPIIKILQLTGFMNVVHVIPDTAE